MAELRPGIPYAGSPGKIYAELRGAKELPCITFEIDLTHEARDGQWVQAPLRNDDGNPHRIWLRWFTTDNAWPYTEQRLRALQFNGDFRNPAVGVQSITVIASQNGQYLQWDTPNGGGSDAKALPDNTADVLTARYRQNNPTPQAAPVPAQAPAPQSEPQPAPQSEPVGATAGEPPVGVTAGGSEDIPF